MAAYYSENDPFAAAWLRELIKAGQIADGEVDDRSIADVVAADLAGFTQCHFFAGIGGWSYALRLAGWDDARACWSGSCPCQPFSAAGRQEGASDPRHLWPEWFRLIRECRPRVLFAEQVESAINHGWLDLVQADLEGEGYAVGAACLPAAGIGAPHLRQRLWFVADRPLADAERAERRPVHGPVADERDRRDVGREEAHGQSGARRPVLGGGGTVADADGGDTLDGAVQRGGQYGLRAEDRRLDGHAQIGERSEGNVADAGQGGRALECPARLHGDGESGHDAAGRGADGNVADPPSGGLGIDGGAPRRTGHADQCEPTGGGADGTGDVGDAASGRGAWVGDAGKQVGARIGRDRSAVTGATHGVEHAVVAGLEGHARDGNDRGEPGRLGPTPGGPAPAAGGAGGVADPGCARRQQIAGSASADEAADGGAGRREPHGDHLGAGDPEVCERDRRVA